jgi:hypothetical protein
MGMFRLPDGNLSLELPKRIVAPKERLIVTDPARDMAGT